MVRPITQSQVEQRHQDRDEGVARQPDAAHAGIGVGRRTGNRHRGGQRHAVAQEVLGCAPAGGVAAAIERRQDEVVAAADPPAPAQRVDQQHVGVDDVIGPAAVARVVDVGKADRVGVGGGGRLVVPGGFGIRQEGLHQPVTIETVRGDVVDVGKPAHHQRERGECGKQHPERTAAVFMVKKCGDGICRQQQAID